MRDEKAAGPIEIPKNMRLKQYCCPAFTKFASLCDGLSIGIWLYALFILVREKIGHLIGVEINWIGSMGQLHFVSSMIVFN